MTTQPAIKQAFDDVADAFRSDPDLGRGTGTSLTTVSEGLRCEVAEGGWTLAVDTRWVMPTAAGGGGSAPPPGVYGRAALGSCLALTYTYWAARAGMQLDHLQVEVQTDYDDGALFGTADVPAGYSEVRYVVRVGTSATEEEVVAVLDEADRHSGYRDVFARSQRCVRTVEVTPAGAPASHGA